MPELIEHPPPPTGPAARAPAAPPSGSPPDPPPRSRFGRAIESLFVRDFRLLWTSTVLSGFGQWGQ
ncbi:MAG: hypothetical protein O3A10_13205 [Chloroflexi bacterium]|nr:hypothetical protein [Chloroflexota bacterium]MDA1148322.1 hypothetical protein [Chloroflexota bacterium]